MLKFSITPLVLFLLQAVSWTYGCEYSRVPGFFPNAFGAGSQPQATETFIDTDVTAGDQETLTFTNPIRFFSGNSTSVTIKDYGRIHIGNLQNLPIPGNDPFPGATAYDLAGLDIFPPTIYRDPSKPFATAYWMDESFTGYQFSYTHITKTTDDVVDGGALCVVQRFEAIISDCERNLYSSKDIVEMLLVTHMFENSTVPGKIYAQTLIGVDTAGVTYVAFIYEDPANTGGETLLTSENNLRGYVNGDYASTVSGSEWASVCRQAFDDPVHTESNCLCGEWNSGVYLFRLESTTDPTATYQPCTETLFPQTSCRAELDLTEEEFFPLDSNPNCMRGVVPTDTCREDVICQLNELEGTTFNLTLRIEGPQFTDVIFIDPTLLAAGNITSSTDTDCQGTLVNDVITFTLTTSDLATNKCFITQNPTTMRLSFAVMNYQSGNVDLIQTGYRFINGGCSFEDVPLNVSNTLFAPVLQEETVTGPAPTLGFHVSLNRGCDENLLEAADEVFVGQDLFLSLSFDYDMAPEDFVSPYGVYGYDCIVSSNADFTDPVELIDNTGCKVNRHTSHAFYIMDAFKSRPSTSVSFCASSGKMDAAKWITGGNMLYFRCSVGFCSNTAIRDEGISKCEDSCTGVTDVARRRRSVDDTQTVETSIRVKQPTPSPDCIGRTIALATLISLCVIILPLGGITFSLFYKLYTRKRM